MSVEAVAALGLPDQRCITCQKEKKAERFRRYGKYAGECDVCRDRLRESRRFEKMFEEPMTTKQLSRLCMNLAEEFLMEGVTPKKIHEAKLTEIVRSADTLFAISQTLEGRPTRIITYKSRQSREELLKAIGEELGRRGTTIDVTPTAVREAVTEDEG